MSKKNTTQHSSYWLDQRNISEEGDVERLMRLAAARRAIGNFVSILTGDSSIKVQFSSGKDSYTDGNTVVISADTNPERFDSMVGLALHEGAHCLLSNFVFLRDTMESIPAFYGSLHEELRTAYPYASHLDEPKLIALRELIKTVMNVIEDRRIDSYVYAKAPGYRPYYDTLYSTYFTNKEVQKAMKGDPEWRVPTIENYINWLILMFDPNFDRTALPALGEMVDMIDLPNIRRFDKSSHDIISVFTDAAYNGQFTRTTSEGTVIENPLFKYEEFPLLWRVSNEIVLKILKYAKLHEPQEDSMEILLDVVFDFGDIDPNALPNLDIQPLKIDKERLERAMEKIKASLNGDIKKKKLSMHDQEQLSSMESASATMNESEDNVVGKVQCMVTRNLTKSMIMSSWFPFSRTYGASSAVVNVQANDGVKAGIRMGQILAHRLQVRNDPTITHFTRQDHGKVDRRMLAQLGMDITSVFKRTTVDSYSPALLYLTLDASGSMAGERWKQCITVATALAYAAEKVRNLDVVISLRGNVNTGMPIVTVAYDSRKDKFQKIRSLFPYLTAGGSTPEGLCYMATLDLIKECTETHRVYFINFSDGEPGCDYLFANTRTAYYGDTAIQHTRKMVNAIKEMGISVMSYFINDAVRDSSKKAFTTMYGQSAEFVNVTNATQVVKTVNKLLLQKG